jgi:hypothetical protein
MTVDEIVDRTEIMDLMIRYCRAADLGDAAGMAAVFADPCEVRLFADQGQVFRSPTAYREALAPLLGKVQAGSHYVGNAEYWFDGDGSAVVHCYMYSWQRFVPDMALPDRHRMGRYELLVTRQECGWRIVSLRLIVVGEDGGNRLCEHVDRPWPPVFIG